jgi:hypothetical protein
MRASLVILRMSVFEIGTGENTSLKYGCQVFKKQFLGQFPILMIHSETFDSGNQKSSPALRPLCDSEILTEP